MLRTVLGYATALLVTYLVGVIGASQHVIGRFESMAGSSVSWAERLSWTLKDVVGMSSPPIYPLAIAVMMLIAFTVAGFLARRLGGLRRIAFVSAGAVGMVGLHLVLNAVFEINSIAASRDLLGLVGQAAAGALGGLAYLSVHPGPSHSDRAQQSPGPSAGSAAGARA